MRDARAARRRLIDLYSDSASAYEALWAPELLPLSRQLLPYLSLAGARAVLDAATGVGSLLPYLKEHAPDAQVVGADLSLGMLRLAPGSFPRVVADAALLSFKDESFDSVVIAFALFHLFDPAVGIREIARILRAEGTVGVITWGDEVDPPAYDIWNAELAARGAPAADPAFARFDDVDTPEKVEALMSAHGLRPVRAWTGEYAARPTPEQFLAHRTGHGRSRLRYEAMPAEARRGCLDAVRSRIDALSPEDFHERAEVVYVVGCKP